MYAILRTKKIKSNGHITQACEHNLRLRQQKNIDSTKTNLNKVLFDSLGIDRRKSSSFQEKLNEYYAGLGIKIRKDNVLLYEYVATASPKFFEDKSPLTIEKWAQGQIKFFKKEFGEQVKFAVLHLDEKTPHLHVYVSTEFRSVKKYKNRFGVSEKETWSLNSNRYNPEFLAQLQSRFAGANAYWNLRRGVKGSRRKNISLKKFYSMVDKALHTDYKEEIENLINGVELSVGERLSMSSIRNKLIEYLAPTINGLFRRQKALKELVKLDFHRLQNDLINERKKVLEESSNVKDLKEVYVEAINGRLEDIKVNEILMEQNIMLAQEVMKMKEKYEGQQQGYLSNSVQAEKYK